MKKNKNKNTFITALVVALGILISVSPANAKRPINVDCDLLATTNVTMNDFLDEEGTDFNNLGDLLSSSILDDELFDQLSTLYLFFSGGEIKFSSASQVVATNAKCGLVPQLVDSTRD